MKKISRAVFLVLGISIPVFNVGAVIQLTATPDPIWYGSSTTAANCSVTFPTLLPLSQPKTLIVDNNLPVGSVLYSWDYSDFMPDIHSVCSGVSSSMVNSITSNSYVRSQILLLNLSSVQVSGNTLFKTSNPGIGLKIYSKYTSKGIGNTGSSTSPESTTFHDSGDVVGVESPLSAVARYFPTHFFPITNSASSPYTIFYDSSANHSKLSFRGELIKIQEVPESSGLQLLLGGGQFDITFNSNVSNTGLYGGVINLDSILGGGGINIVHPTCQLRGTTDYQVNLGSWESVSSSSLPAYSESKPVDINIECSGKLNNVEFSFQDTGSSSLSNRNISVYDGIGGQQINGLEIEMSYAGSRIDVHKISESPTSYKVNTGSHGSVKTNPTDTSFNSQSHAQFEARFVQRAAITRGGSSYTGPVTGQVNMFITYN